MRFGPIRTGHAAHQADANADGDDKEVQCDKKSEHFGLGTFGVVGEEMDI